MTTFTRLHLNPSSRQARKLLGNPQAMHAAVLSCFPKEVSDKERILWRHDGKIRGADEHSVYIVGPDSCDPSKIAEQTGSEHDPQKASYNRLLEALADGQQWHYEVVLNPVAAKKAPGSPRGTRGKLTALVGEEAQLEWFRSKAKSCGFTPLETLIVERKTLRFSKLAKNPKGRQVVIGTVRYRGTLQIDDVESFRKSLVEGIGRGKAYGCGLLTLAKPTPSKTR